MANYSITDTINFGYNCIGWSENPGWPRNIWPPRSYQTEDPQLVMDRFYGGIGMRKDGVAPAPDFAGTVVALYADSKGPQHAARRDRDDPDWWESKLGLNVRVMHRLEELEGGMYGDVVAFYTRRDP
jgi:hypothetical protein